MSKITDFFNQNLDGKSDLMWPEEREERVAFARKHSGLGSYRPATAGSGLIQKFLQEFKSREARFTMESPRRASISPVFRRNSVRQSNGAAEQGAPRDGFAARELRRQVYG